MNEGPTAIDRYQILALSGGGFRGLFTGEYLRRCEEFYSLKIHERFDLIAGTSIGALLAAGFALGRPAADPCEAMIAYGPRIFARSPMTFPRRLLRGSPYDTTILEEAIEAVLTPDGANMPLNEIDHPLMITAVNYTQGSSTIFRSRGLAQSRASDVRVKDAVLASAAAPTFFPLRKLKTDQFADGGLIANAPDLLAITDTIAARRAPLDSIYLLSVGTAARRKGAALHERPLSPSILSWFFVRGLVQTIMSAQEDLTIKSAAQLLGERHLRIDEEPAQQQVAAIAELDYATSRSIETLISLASQAFERTGRERKLRAFF
ncbi:CBASS cGAMP-activated phospholipase [Allomesorhizobium alhagi]|uniref:Patatin n=1 Tax=Mesorhizobium alhagi CCNWXJ12-2 TaxID=1107882 RepID=H0HWQ2_9HYPH|nr:CBASS cGAMP-activated phospholipase [Mesorhizobium alhagi]EHK54851.1 Patatin [Mesorhizobium alhagi CCNWXJ12-2]